MSLYHTEYWQQVIEESITHATAQGYLRPCVVCGNPFFFRTKEAEICSFCEEEMSKESLHAS
ncbi:hypothetical protein [Sulfoacidibacillus thermotolerans]|uniref:Uncharacterized protein n=1 Tax=Sulfoacidibacillus thermotolerans TaxID=1765684 RepID=A0A2U3D5T4_SULT2|nr:hypothetical protein [Sulfoacidibacillus thermotolerans]PWI56627.1 hypothetical protein BM613_12665 [Sulfoacidibacillus thermotolerans]